MTAMPAVTLTARKTVVSPTHSSILPTALLKAFPDSRNPLAPTR